MARAENLRQFVAGAPVSATDFSINYDMLEWAINNVDGSQISEETITSDNLRVDSITREKLTNGVVSSRNIADNAIMGWNFADKSITADKLESSDILPVPLQFGETSITMTNPPYNKKWSKQVTFPVPFDNTPNVIVTLGRASGAFKWETYYDDEFILKSPYAINITSISRFGFNFWFVLQDPFQSSILLDTGVIRFSWLAVDV